MEDLNVPIFAQAKLEYTNQLVDVLYPHMYDGIKSIYDESKVIHIKKTGVPILFLFRELLEKVPIWNSEIIESECSRIIHNSKCDWIEDLITAVFISHTKILTSIGPSNTFNKINVTIPKTTSFIHKTYVNLARELWKNPYLFNENVPGHEYQRNSKEIENIIKQCVEGTVRQLLPIKEILREHLDTYDSDNIPRGRDDIKLLLKEELQELKKQLLNSDYRNIDNEDNEENEDNEDNEYIDKGNESFRVTKEVTGVIPKEQIKDLVITDFPSDSVDLPGTDLPGTTHTIESEPLNLYISESNEDPSEEQIKKQVSDIVVNDITIPVSDIVVNDITIPVSFGPGEDCLGAKEIIYDNADIMEYKEVNEEGKVKKMLTNLEPININVIKTDTINGQESDSGPELSGLSGLPGLPGLPISDNSSFKLDNIFGLSSTTPVEPKVGAIDPNETNGPMIGANGTNGTNEPNETNETKVGAIDPNETKVGAIDPNETKVGAIDPNETKVGAIDPNETNETNEPKVVANKPKEIITIDSNDIDETSSLANFFNDMKQVVEDKGIRVESSTNFTLFEDASEVG